MDFSQGLQGAGGGALAGGAFGGPVGAAIGGGLGLLGGLFGDSGAQGYQDMLKKLAAGFQNRQAPQMGPASQAGYSGFRQNQAGLIAQLESMARGDGPSAAATMMKQAMDEEAGAQASAAAGAGGRGVNAGAALRNATNNTAALQAKNARDTGLMRVEEQLGATQQLGNAISQGRGADEGVNMFNAGQTNNVNQANLEAQLKTLGLNDQSQLQALMMAMGVAGPGTGTQILAGGANALPGLLQYAMQKPQGGGSNFSMGGDGTVYSGGNYGQGVTNGLNSLWGLGGQ